MTVRRSYSTRNMYTRGRTNYRADIQIIVQTCRRRNQYKCKYNRLSVTIEVEGGNKKKLT